MKTLIAFSIALLFAATSFGQVAQTIKGTDKTSSQLIEKVKRKKAYLIDVRTPEEYKAGHLKYATNIDFKSANFKEEVKKLNKKRPVYLYCRTGNRSGKAADSLQALGFKSYYNIGGFEELKLAGLPQE
jgi:rhodanese-related sulfurtransferase